MSRGTSLSGRLRLLWILLLALASGPALALGLGPIEVKSRHGQPLLAEIPVVSSDPSELELLQARLASPETFRRVGLEPPGGVVSDLDFIIALDPQGRPVIRITSDAPVQEALLTFLLEVDWGHGRLVREYSALVDAPQTAAASVQAPILAPEPAPASTIVRPPAMTADAAPPADPVATVQDEADAPGEPPAPRPQAAATDGELAPVRAGQTLSGIAAELGAGTGRTLEQTMIALLRANPEAFIRDNINLLRQGAVLRVPDEAAWSGIDPREAGAIVREHVGQWRALRSPVPQPVDAAGGAGAPQAGQAGAAQVAAADARLSIVPPSADDGRQAGAGTRSGISAGGEGEMLRQQELIQTTETLAAREAEVQELKARVAELESLQQQQQQLIAMKDSELAAAQQRLAAGNAAADVAGAPAGAWLWGGAGLLLAGGIAWWLASRRAARVQQRSRGFLDEARRSPPPQPAAAAAAVAVVEDAQDDGVAPVPAAADAGAALADAGWRAQPAEPAVPPWHAADRDGATLAATIAPLNPAPAGQARIELARAYLDLGDVETARALLQEVADTGDAASRGEAALLLRELA